MDKYWWRRKKSKKVPLCHSHENGNPVFSDSCIPSGFPLSREWRLFTDCRIHSASRSQDTARLLRCMTCPIYFHTCSPGIYWNHICIASKKAGFCRSNGTCFLLPCVVSPCMKIVYVQWQSCSVIIHRFIFSEFIKIGYNYWFFSRLVDAKGSRIQGFKGSRDRNCCPPYLRCQAVSFFLRESFCYFVNF